MSDIECNSESSARLSAALESLKSGGGVIIVDDPLRENEADLVFSSDFLTENQVARMIRDCSGIICLCLPPDKVDSLELPLMAPENTSRYGTNFTVSIESRKGVSTGVSAHDRLATIKAACSPSATRADLATPGHVFPLRANPKGVVGRDGHTEATVDIMKLAGLSPFGVLCELTNPDGSMAKGKEIFDYGKKYGFPVVAVSDIKAFIVGHLK